MIATRDDGDILLINGIDQPVGIVDAAGIKPGKIFFEYLRFSDTFKRAALSSLSELIDPF